MTTLQQLANLGQSVWLDFIRRSFIKTGELNALIQLGVHGLTSNPSIFEKAIANSSDYDRDIKHLTAQGKSATEVYTDLTVRDIQLAADLLSPIYRETKGLDGFVSLEVSPKLARDTYGTLEEARRLWNLVDRPNLMVKIPATREGLPAITQTLAEGININVTLIFSIQRYQEVMDAYLTGINSRIDNGLPVENVASVASFFISRLDSQIDRLLQERIEKQPGNIDDIRALLGKTAVAHARLAYQKYLDVFRSPAFESFAAHGARVQRPLWASTSTKNPDYSDILYVQELIGPDTVNTMPAETMAAFMDHGIAENTLTTGIDQAKAVLQAIDDLEIDIEAVNYALEQEGLDAFEKSFDSLMRTLEARQNEYRRPLNLSASLGIQQGQILTALEQLKQERIIDRIWSHDFTVWQPEATEISNRLGWLRIAENIQPELSQLNQFVDGISLAGFTQAVLLGMGGSSLAPELFSKIFTDENHPLKLLILDSTDPGAVIQMSEKLDYSKTLFIVSTKSGGTEETNSFFKYFFNQTAERLGRDLAGSHFIAITDPGSSLAEIAKTYNFRTIFLNDPNIGGRYSALSFFGLVPAVIAGVDAQMVLDSALLMAQACSPASALEQNPGAKLGAILGVMALSGRNKLTLIMPDRLASLADWIEQLVAESTGKAGKGILPITRERILPASSYGNDRLFVRIRCKTDLLESAEFEGLRVAGHPVLDIVLDSLEDLSGQFFLWEFATAVAAYFLQINPFDQPDVESAKKAARSMTAAYIESGQMPLEAPLLSTSTLSVYGRVNAESPAACFRNYLAQAQPGDYVAIQAFLTPDNDTTSILSDLRGWISEHYELATTLGYGPRFLHSTGQLHKGDAGNGIFIQLTCDPAMDIPIPMQAGSKQSAISFGVLILSQALGDQKALLEAGRRVVRFHFRQPIQINLSEFVDQVTEAN